MLFGAATAPEFGIAAGVVFATGFSAALLLSSPEAVIAPKLTGGMPPAFALAPGPDLQPVIRARPTAPVPSKRRISSSLMKSSGLAKGRPIGCVKRTLRHGCVARTLQNLHSVISSVL